jgi:S1-C subfamily serine protease
VFSKFEETDERVSGTKKEKKRKRGASGAPYVALIVLCFLGAAALIGYVSYSEYAQRPEALPPVEDQSADDSADHSTPLPLPDVSDAQTVYLVGAKSSVGVAVTRGGKTQYASGTVVFDGGFVATLFEVVADAERIEIITADGSRFPAELIGTEPRVNLALLSCPASLSAVSVVSDGATAAGSSVFAIGNLEGDGYGASLVRTYVAYADRQARIDDADGKEWVWSVIQLGRLGDESLAGCPVFDPSGHAVSIALSCPPQGEVSLAIPIERALAVLRCIRDGTPAPEAALAAIAHAPPTLGILGEQRQTDSLVGICVVGFTSSDCDAAKKLRAGDIIYKIGDTPTPDAATLKGAVECKKPSESVEVFISRGNQKLSFWVQLQ